MDKIDHQILTILRKNAKTTNSAISEAVGLYPSAVLERVRKLERKGYVKGYHAYFNLEKVGLPVLAFVMIKVSLANWGDEISESLSKVPCVLEAYEISGDYSYLLKVVARDMDHLSDLLKNKVGSISGISNANTTFVYKSLKGIDHFPLDEGQA